MNYESKLIEKFLTRGVFKGNELYLPLAAALDLVDWCVSKQLAVVGVEGFIWDSITLMSQMDIITDFSRSEAKEWAEYVSKCNSLAKEYLLSIPERKGLVINLTVICENEWMIFK